MQDYKPVPNAVYPDTSQAASTEACLVQNCSVPSKVKNLPYLPDVYSFLTFPLGFQQNIFNTHTRTVTQLFGEVNGRGNAILQSISLVYM